MEAQVFLAVALLALWTLFTLVLGVSMGWRMKGGQSPLAPVSVPNPFKKKEPDPEAPKPKPQVKV